jgi:hypothetical protein
VAAFYDFLNKNTGNTLKFLTRSPNEAVRNAVLGAALPADRLLNGIARNNWQKTIADAVQQIPGLSVNNPNYGTLISALQLVQDMFDAAAYDPNSERGVVVATTRSVLDNLRSRGGAEEWPTLESRWWTLVMWMPH